MNINLDLKPYISPSSRRSHIKEDRTIKPDNSGNLFSSKSIIEKCNPVKIENLEKLDNERILLKTLYKINNPNKVLKTEEISKITTSSNFNPQNQQSTYKPSITREFENNNLESQKYNNLITKNFFTKKPDNIQIKKNVFMQNRAEFKNKNLIKTKKNFFIANLHKNSQTPTNGIDNECVLIKKLDIDERYRISNLKYSNKKYQIRRGASAAGFTREDSLDQSKYDTNIRENTDPLEKQFKTIYYENDSSHINGIEIYNSLIVPVTKVPKAKENETLKVKQLQLIKSNKNQNKNQIYRLLISQNYLNILPSQHYKNPDQILTTAENQTKSNEKDTTNPNNSNTESISDLKKLQNDLLEKVKKITLLKELTSNISKKNQDSEFLSSQKLINPINPKFILNNEKSYDRTKRKEIKENLISHTTIDFDSDNNKQSIKNRILKKIIANLKLKINSNSNLKNKSQNNTIGCSKSCLGTSNSKTGKIDVLHLGLKENKDFIKEQLLMLNQKNEEINKMNKKNKKKKKINSKNVVTEPNLPIKPKKVCFYDKVRQQHLNHKLQFKNLLHKLESNTNKDIDLDKFKTMEDDFNQQELENNINLNKEITDILIELFGKEQFEKYRNSIIE